MRCESCGSKLPFDWYYEQCHKCIAKEAKELNKEETKGLL